VCIHRIPHKSSITASAGRGITQDQRHAAADQISSIVSRAKEKEIPKLQLGNISSCIGREASSLKNRGNTNSFATVKEDNFPHRSGEREVLSRAEEKLSSNATDIGCSNILWHIRQEYLPHIEARKKIKFPYLQSTVTNQP
jgi:hypothetical protein